MSCCPVFVQHEPAKKRRGRESLPETTYVPFFPRSLAAVQPVEHHLPLSGQAELSAPSVHVGRVDFVAADLQHAGNVTQMLLGTACAVIPQLAEDRVANYAPKEVANSCGLCAVTVRKVPFRFWRANAWIQRAAAEGVPSGAAVSAAPVPSSVRRVVYRGRSDCRSSACRRSTNASSVPPASFNSFSRTACNSSRIGFFVIVVVSAKEFGRRTYQQLPKSSFIE